MKRIIDEILELTNDQRMLNQIPGPVYQNIPVNNIIDIEKQNTNMLVTYYDKSQHKITAIQSNNEYDRLKQQTKDFHNPLVAGRIREEMFYLNKTGKILGVKILESNDKKISILWAGTDGSYDYKNFGFNNSDEAFAAKQEVIDQNLLVSSNLANGEYLDQQYFSESRLQLLLGNLLAQMKPEAIIEISRVGKQICWKQRVLSVETRLFSVNTLTERDIIFQKLISTLASQDLMKNIKIA